MKTWFNERFPLWRRWVQYFKQYQVPRNLNAYYCFGALAILVFAGQWLSGLWLLMFYTPTTAGAFDSIELIMRDVSFGWLFRYVHSTGASAFFIILYLHLFRGLLYGSYQKPRELVWLVGVVLLLLTMAEAFFGQVLPWGQLSYWGAEVITSLFGVIPFVGDTLVTWVRGDYVVGDATLHRFFALHVIAIPIVMVLLVFFHVSALHQVGSNNPEGIDLNPRTKRNVSDWMPFYPDYVRKDVFAILIFLLLFFAVVFFAPHLGGLFLEKMNFNPANPLETPESITPMWYMLPFYSLLRAFPGKGWGVLAMNVAILIWFFLPWLDRSPVRSMRYKGIFSKAMLALFTLNFILLGCLGKVPITPNSEVMTKISALIYFAYFLTMPVYTRYEQCKPLPKRL